MCELLQSVAVKADWNSVPLTLYSTLLGNFAMLIINTPGHRLLTPQCSVCVFISYPRHEGQDVVLLVFDAVPGVLLLTFLRVTQPDGSSL